MTEEKISKQFYVFTMTIVVSLIACILLWTPPVKKPTVNNVNNSAASKLAGLSISEQNQLILNGNIVFGKSGLGEKLVCVKISPKTNIKNKILMTYEIHGFEDTHTPSGRPVKDGVILVRMAHIIANYFLQHPDLLGNSALYIVPSLNPDGLSHGYTNNGKGRCQITLGIDLNRDFPYYFVQDSDSRYYTLSKPFSAPESRAVKNLVEAIKPNVVIDCHGWNDKLIGNQLVASCFSSSMGIGETYEFAYYYHGYLSAWASTQGAEAMLLEYPTSAYTHLGEYAGKTILSIQNLVEKLK